MLEWPRRVLGHGVKSPEQPAVFGVIGRDIAANPEIRAAVADKNLVAHHPGRTRDGVGFVAVDGVDIPQRAAIGLVQRDQPAVEGAQKHAPVGDRNTPVDHVATALGRPLPGNLGIVPPQDVTAAGVEGDDPAPGRGHIHDAVHDNGGRFQAALTVQGRLPGQAHLVHVARVNLCER